MSLLKNNHSTDAEWFLLWISLMKIYDLIGFFAILLPSLVSAQMTNIVNEPTLFEPIWYEKDAFVSQNIDSDKVAIIHQMAVGDDIEAKINHAMIYRQWHELPVLLAEYKNYPTYDETLYQYALGAWHRSQNQHKKAIELYQRILNTYPELNNVRFDLGVMAFENKQYKDAKQYLTQAKAGLNAPMQQLAEQFLQIIAHKERWLPHVHANYERNNNINNAASATTIQWQGKIWHKTEDSLPKSGKGVRYGFGISKDTNIAGNHFLVLDTDIKGVHYWNIDGYDERNFGARAGYQYQTVLNSISVLPFYEKHWLDNDVYLNEKGISMVGGHQFSKWHTRLNMRYAKKSYASERLSQHYDGHIWSLGVNFSRPITNNVLLFIGGDRVDETTKAADKSSVRYGMSAGLLAEHPNGVGTRVSVRYAKRRFDMPDTWFYQKTRQDDEYGVQAAFWYKAINYKGFMPKFNIYYHKIDSNMPELYSRDGLQAFVSIDKRF